MTCSTPAKRLFSTDLARAGLTQKALADKLGVTSRSIRNWLDGRLPASRVPALERVLGFKLTHLSLEDQLMQRDQVICAQKKLIENQRKAITSLRAAITRYAPMGRRKPVVTSQTPYNRHWG